MNRSKWFRLALSLLLAMSFATGVVGCRGQNQADVDDESEVSEPERDLAFNNITLEQSNDAGQLIWRMTADQAIYSQDQRVAEIDRPTGEFFRDDEPTLQVQADMGEVKNDGEQIFLFGNVVATDVETGAIVRGDELEWRTGQDMVIVRKNVIGTHPDFRIAAREARAFIQEERIEIRGKVAAISNDEDLQLQADQLVWLLDEERLVSDRPIQIQQLEDDAVTARAEGDRAEFNLATEVAILENNAVVNLQQPPIRVTGNSLQWNLVDNTVEANEPFSVFHREEQITLAANQGNGDLDTQVFDMAGDVVVTAEQNDAQLTSNELTWTIPTQDIVAEGDVVYRQTDPVFNLRGPIAEGKLENQTIVVSGGRVVTEIIPDTVN